MAGAEIPGMRRRNAPSAPSRKSIHDRIAQRSAQTNPLTESSVDTLADVGSDTGTFRIDSTGELVLDDIAPLPLAAEVATPLGSLDKGTAQAYHLLLLPEHVDASDLEALAISVWNQAGWLSPGNLRMQEGSTLEGPWSLSSEVAAALELAPQTPLNQVWVLRCPARRGAAPSPEVTKFSEWAKAFPGGMPVGVEERVLSVLRRIARRLGGSLRIAGSGYTMTPDPDSSVNLRVYASSWLSPAETMELLEPYVPGIYSPGPLPDASDSPYAFMAPAGSRSQILVGVRAETLAPRALRWEIWAKEKLFLYEIVWALPEDLYRLDEFPTRAGRLERSRASDLVDTVAAVLAERLNDPAAGGAAIIDEDDFLVALDAPLRGAEPQHP